MTRALLIVFLLTLGFSTHADDASTSTLKVERPADQVNKPPGEDVDLIITNNKMRAETGSKSRYSIASSLSYSGGSLASPGNERRPNLSAATGTTDIASIGGSISGKFAIDSVNSLFGGVGLRWLAPMDAGTPVGYNGSKFDVDNPYLNYQYLYRWSGVQSALTLDETFYTNANLVHAGYVTQWSVSQNNMYDLGHSGFTVGCNVYATLSYFDKNDVDVKAYQSDYAFGLTPAIEYRLTDKLNLRTDSNPWSFQHLRSYRNANAYQMQHWAQTLSLGWAVTRDIYVSPGFQWLPEDIRIDRTVTWLSANINVF